MNVLLAYQTQPALQHCNVLCCLPFLFLNQYRDNLLQLRQDMLEWPHLIVLLQATHN